MPLMVSGSIIRIGMLDEGVEPDPELIGNDLLGCWPIVRVEQLVHGDADRVEAQLDAGVGAGRSGRMKPAAEPYRCELRQCRKPRGLAAAGTRWSSSSACRSFDTSVACRRGLCSTSCFDTRSGSRARSHSPGNSCWSGIPGSTDWCVGIADDGMRSVLAAEKWQARVQPVGYCTEIIRVDLLHPRRLRLAVDGSPIDPETSSVR